MAIQPGTTLWSTKVVGGGSGQGDAPYIDGTQLAGVSAWSVTTPPPANLKRALSQSSVIQASPEHPEAVLNMLPATFSFTSQGFFEDDWIVLERVRGSTKVLANWPLGDEWGISGAAGQRTKFYISRWFPWALTSFALAGDQVSATFFPNAGVPVPLEIVTALPPVGDQVLIPTTVPSLTDPAAYTIETGDLESHGPGVLQLRYNPLRIGVLTVQTSALTNVLPRSFGFAESLPRRRWAEANV